jgi:hypothetical protein
MTPRTLPLSLVPDSWRSWDTMVQSARAQNAINRDEAAERQALKESFVEELQRLMARGGVREYAFFAKKRNKVQAPQVWEELWDVANERDFPRHLMTLLFMASEGQSVQAYAKEILGGLCEQVAEYEAEVRTV